MNGQTSPKRVTRARAAAKTTDATVKTTRIATAASKAKATRSAPATKRKTPVGDAPDDVPNDPLDELIEPELPKPRGRPKKTPVVQPEMDELAPAPPKPRGRPRKVDVEATAPEPPRPRGRPRKVDVPRGESTVAEPPTKTTRTRTATTSKSTAPKKSVQFEEPDKENIIPPPANVKGKQEEVATGLKAKPVRKPAATASRPTRGRPKLEDHKASPLSPKKATQVTTGKDNLSDDELAGSEKTPTKPLMRSPMKPPGGVFGGKPVKNLDFSNSISVNGAGIQNLSGSVMASPARRPPSSPFKESSKSSPQGQRVGDCLLRSPLKLAALASKPTDLSVPLAASLLRSPARRPPSPTKVTENGSPTRRREKNMIDSATPSTLTKGAARAGQVLRPSVLQQGSASDLSKIKDTDESDMLSVPKFSGRLSSILPRDSDPALTSCEPATTETGDQQEIEGREDPAVIYETVAGIKTHSTTPPMSPSRASTGAFDLREVDENPFQDSDSEDELASKSPKYSPTLPTAFGVPSPSFASSPATPTAFTAIRKTPRTAKSIVKTLDSKLLVGFTPLAKNPSDWMPMSPDRRKTGLEEYPISSEASNIISVGMGPVVQPSPVRSSYFDDEMSVRDEMQRATDAPEQIIDDADFSPLELDEEDYALAHEADEMSLLEPDQLETIEHDIYQPASREPEHVPAAGDVADEFINTEQAHTEEMIDKFVYTDPANLANSDDHAMKLVAGDTEQVGTVDALVELASAETATSEASEEYGDENAIPIDPALLALDTQTTSAPEFVTPKRILTERVLHTISKVPLKDEAEASSMRPSPMKRSASISKLPNQRPTNNLTRSKTVISYSPSKKARSRSPRKGTVIPNSCATPSKVDTDVWSTIGTPARTPRRDLNTGLLKGAVVFVDVHTTEGADASGLFTELLTQMGARCVKRWDWNGSKEDGSKIGITHVVFKDGGKRTLEKAKESGGVISCVGVGWVLE